MAFLQTFIILLSMWPIINGGKVDLQSTPLSDITYTRLGVNLTTDELKALVEFSELEAEKETATKNNNAYACGQSNKSDRIAGGTATVPNEFPWQAWLIFTSGNQQYVCGGSLISDKWVLTAAQCILGNSGAQVVLGSHYQNSAIDAQRRVYTASRYIKNPIYNPNNLEADLALVELSTTVPFNDFIRPICLPSTSDTDHENDNAIISGWGSTFGTNSDISSTLRKATVTVISNSQCSSYYGTAITSNKMCTSGSSGRGICAGDGGGPLSYVKSNGAHTQIGIISFSSAYGCSAGYPSGYTRLRPYISWISAQTGIQSSAITVSGGKLMLLCSALSIFAFERFL